MKKLDKLIENRDAILLAEIGALIHDLGKLHKTFVEQHAEECTSDKKYDHGNVLDEDAKRDEELGSLAKSLKEILENCQIFDSNLYEMIKEHHNKGFQKILIKLILSADQFDAGEDRAGAKDRQSLCKTFGSSAFGKEYEINLSEFERLRKETYRVLIDTLNTCDLSKIIKERSKLLDTLEYHFFKALGMTARAANDVTLWDHSYMTASIMKALMAYRILDSNFIVESRRDIINVKPFKIFAIGWDFFGFIEQSHKISDVTGRIGIINEIKKEIKSIIEEEYALGNSIYEDDFGIYFLIPSIIDEEDLKEIKEKIFDIFNEKVKGILLPIFHVEQPKNIQNEFRIGELIAKAIESIKKKIVKNEVDLIKTPAWVEAWKNSAESSEDKLVCNVCGKGYYHKGDEEKICGICKSIRKKGRLNRELQTIFIDEISWNSEKRRYENVCLLVAKFDLEKWMNGEYVRSLFVRKLDREKVQWFKDFYGSKLYKQKNGELILNEDLIKSELLDLGALMGYLKSGSKGAKEKVEKQIKKCLKKFDSLDDFSKKLLSSVKENLETADKLIDDGNISELKDVFSKLDHNKIIGSLKKHIENVEKSVLNYQYKNYEQQSIKDARGIDEIIQKLFLKPPSPSRLMRMWDNTTNFFKMVAKKIQEEVSDVIEVNIKIADLKLRDKKLVEGLAYIIKIPRLGVSGEVICEESCEEPSCFKVVTPHLSEFLTTYKDEALSSGIEIYHPEKKNLLGVAIINDIIPVSSHKAYRKISISSALFMAIIPASKSWEILKTIKKEYTNYFGKVFGKLPLHIGLVYFKRKMPISVVLNSVEGFANEFESLNVRDELYLLENSRTEDINIILELRSTKDKQRYTIRIPYKLGDGKTDYYHPYLMVKDLCNDVIKITYGDSQFLQKHVSRLKPGDRIILEPSFFDFEFLDSNIRRLDIGKKRKHWLFVESTNKPKPYLLCDIDNFKKLRKLIQKLELTNTQIMNLYEMLVSKIEEWELKDLDKLRNCQTFKKLVESSIKSYPLRLEVIEGESMRGKISGDDYEFLVNSILNGLFFDFVDLWHTIFKKDFRGGEK